MADKVYAVDVFEHDVDGLGYWSTKSLHWTLKGAMDAVQKLYTVYGGELVYDIETREVVQ